MGQQKFGSKEVRFASLQLLAAATLLRALTVAEAWTTLVEMIDPL